MIIHTESNLWLKVMETAMAADIQAQRLLSGNHGYCEMSAAVCVCVCVFMCTFSN